MELSTDQKKVIKELFSWLATSGRPQFITVGGYAGTGKTTLMAVFRKHVLKQNKDIKVAFCAYTGKAARVLKSRLEEIGGVGPEDYVSTIHSLIYSPVTNDKKEIIDWRRRQELDYDLIVLDEASMVDEQIWADLRSFKLPIIAIGDHGQLPPISGTFNLMESPQLTLTHIHRQAEENPIIQMSIHAREEGIIKPGKYGPGVEKVVQDAWDAGDRVTEIMENFHPDTMILCGYNTTRVRLNKGIRQAREIFAELPQVKDRVICLKNNHDKEIYNGMLGTILRVEDVDKEGWLWAEIEMDGEKNNFTGLINKEQFGNSKTISDPRVIAQGDLFDFGYALTVHKAQGSQAPRVVVFEERFSRMSDDDWRKWLYTAITRAEKELYIIGT